MLSNKNSPAHFNARLKKNLQEGNDVIISLYKSIYFNYFLFSVFLLQILKTQI
jgi:hypothetical protein